MFLNNIRYTSRNLFTSRGSCDVAVTWQAKQLSINILLRPIATRISVSAIHDENDDVLGYASSLLAFRYGRPCRPKVERP